MNVSPSSSSLFNGGAWTLALLIPGVFFRSWCFLSTNNQDNDSNQAKTKLTNAVVSQMHHKIRVNNKVNCTVSYPVSRGDGCWLSWTCPSDDTLTPLQTSGHNIVLWFLTAALDRKLSACGVQAHHKALGSSWCTRSREPPAPEGSSHQDVTSVTSRQTSLHCTLVKPPFSQWGRWLSSELRLRARCETSF